MGAFGTHWHQLDHMQTNVLSRMHAPQSRFSVVLSPRSVRLSVPWRSCLGNRNAGCLQLSHRRPTDMCGQVDFEIIDLTEVNNNNNNDRLTAFDPGQPG